MKRRIKKTFFLVLLPFVFLLGTIVIFLMKLTSPTVTIKEIYFPNLKETIFIKNMAKGLNYSVTVISISLNRNFKPNSEIEYVYKAEPTLFYKILNDTLIVYCGVEAQIPKKFESKIRIIQNKVSNYEFLKLRENHTQRGIEYFIPKYYDKAIR